MGVVVESSIVNAKAFSVDELGFIVDAFYALGVRGGT